MDQVIMFGYMVLFVSSFPMAPFMGYVSNILQIHEYGNNLLWRKQRNQPLGAQSIGTFQLCFEFIAAAAVVTNAALIFFTMRDSLFPDYASDSISWLFFLTVYLLFKLMEIVRTIIPDVPDTVRIQRLRQTYFEETVFVKTREHSMFQDHIKRIMGTNCNTLEKDGIIYSEGKEEGFDLFATIWKASRKFLKKIRSPKDAIGLRVAKEFNQGTLAGRVFEYLHNANHDDVPLWQIEFDDGSREQWNHEELMEGVMISGQSPETVPML